MLRMRIIYEHLLPYMDWVQQAEQYATMLGFALGITALTVYLGVIRGMSLGSMEAIPFSPTNTSFRTTHSRNIRSAKILSTSLSKDSKITYNLISLAMSSFAWKRIFYIVLGFIFGLLLTAIKASHSVQKSRDLIEKQHIHLIFIDKIRFRENEFVKRTGEIEEEMAKLNRKYINDFNDYEKAESVFWLTYDKLLCKLTELEVAFLKKCFRYKLELPVNDSMCSSVVDNLIKDCCSKAIKTAVYNTKLSMEVIAEKYEQVKTANQGNLLDFEANSVEDNGISESNMNISTSNILATPDIDFSFTTEFVARPLNLCSSTPTNASVISGKPTHHSRTSSILKAIEIYLDANEGSSLREGSSEDSSVIFNGDHEPFRDSFDNPEAPIPIYTSSCATNAKRCGSESANFPLGERSTRASAFPYTLNQSISPTTPQHSAFDRNDVKFPLLEYKKGQTTSINF